MSVDVTGAAGPVVHESWWSRLRRPLQVRLLAVLVFLLVFCIYLPTLGFDFVDYDDSRNIFQNPYYGSEPLSNLLFFWHAPYNQQYMPLTWTVWGLLAHLGATSVPIMRVGGPPIWIDPLPFHLLCVLVHATNATLVFFLLRRLIRRKVPAAFGALLFGLHPFQTECASWVNGGNVSLVFLFGLSALLIYVRAGDIGDANGWRRTIAYAAATLCFVLALLCKVTAVCLVPAALVLQTALLRRDLRRSAPLLLGWSGIALAFIAYNLAGSQASHAVHVPLWGRPFVAGDALAFYMGRLVWTSRFMLDYTRRPGMVLGSPWGYLTWLAPAAATIAVWRSGARPLQAAWGVFVAGLLPMLGLVPFYYQAYSTVADRYVYLAMLGPAIAVAWLLTRPAGRRPAMRVLAAAVLGFLALQSVSQSLVWTNTLTLFDHNLALNPTSPVAHYNLGNALTWSGKREEAIAHFRWVAEHDPTMAPESELGWAVALQDMGRDHEAERHYLTSLRLQPNQWQATNGLAEIAERRGDYRLAADWWQKSLLMAPDNQRARAGLANARAHMRE